MYAIDDRFFTEAQDIAEYLEYEFLVEQADDFTVEAYECDLETIGFLSGEIIAERAFDEDRFSEESSSALCSERSVNTSAGLTPAATSEL